MAAAGRREPGERSRATAVGAFGAAAPAGPWRAAVPILTRSPLRRRLLLDGSRSAESYTGDRPEYGPP
jgi:hypothetical protein